MTIILFHLQHRLACDDILHHLPALSEILASCVNGGALGELYAAFRAAKRR